MHFLISIFKVDMCTFNLVCHNKTNNSVNIKDGRETGSGHFDRNNMRKYTRKLRHMTDIDTRISDTRENNYHKHKT